MAEKDLQVIVKAKELALHTMKLTSNCNRYPKKYRHSLVDKMQNKCLDIYTTAASFIVIKSGFILRGIISPYAAITKDFVKQLRNFSRECEKAFKGKQEKDAEQVRMF
jgi:hypothetical protein